MINGKGILITAVGLGAIATFGAGTLIVHSLAGGGMYFLSEAMLNDLPEDVRRKCQDDNTALARKYASGALGVAAFIDPIVGTAVGISLLVGTRVRKLYAMKRALEAAAPVTVADALTMEVPTV